MYMYKGSHEYNVDCHKHYIIVTQVYYCYLVLSIKDYMCITVVCITYI